MKEKTYINIIPMKKKFLYTLLILITTFLYIFSLSQLKMNVQGGTSSLLKAFDFLMRMLHFDFSEWQDVLKAAVESFSVAILATIISAVLAFFISFLAASNVSIRFLPAFIKGVSAVVRAIPTLIWALIFVAYLGFGPFAGVLGLCFHSTAYLIKAFSESIEEVKGGCLEAMRATGASWIQAMARGVVPTIQTSLISWTALRFEINVGQSAILGLVGAGGIGQELTINMRSYDFGKAGFVLLIIALMSFGIELLFHKLKLKVDNTKL
ncbi:MAG: phosphonate ABC transporter, permease protein PhnE [Thermotaleaceae bacterium]